MLHEVSNLLTAHLREQSFHFLPLVKGALMCSQTLLGDFVNLLVCTSTHKLQHKVNSQSILDAIAAYSDQVHDAFLVWR